MRAVYITDFDRSENLEVREVPGPPRPAGNEVVVRVRAAGLNRADLLQRRGLYPPPHGISPNIPGLEFAGEVVDVGEEVECFRSGDRVFGITAGEAQAEYVLTDSRVLAAIPANLSFAEAAAVPEVFITAHDALFTQCELKAEEWLLIHAVGSGVGLAALQLAKAGGAHVVGTSRSLAKLDRCREFGLDVALHTPDPVFADNVKAATGGGADVVLDLVGGKYFPENLKSLALRGRMVIVGLTAGRASEIDLGMVLSKRLRLIGTVLRARAIDEKAAVTASFVADVLPLLSVGQVKPNLDRVFPVSEVRSAYEYLESNESFGKVVLEF